MSGPFYFWGRTFFFPKEIRGSAANSHAYISNEKMPHVLRLHFVVRKAITKKGALNALSLSRSPSISASSLLFCLLTRRANAQTIQYSPYLHDFFSPTINHRNHSGLLMQLYNSMTTQVLAFSEPCDTMCRLKSNWNYTVKLNPALHHTKFENIGSQVLRRRPIFKVIFQNNLSRVLSPEFQSCAVNLAWASTNQQIVEAYHISPKSTENCKKMSVEVFHFSYDYDLQ